MKVVSSLIILVTIVLCSCQDRNVEQINEDCIEVSYVTGICGQAVLKIKDPALFHYGETWNGHSNVFYAVFDCTVNETELNQNTFFVKVRGTRGEKNVDCVQCLATVDYQGNKRFFASVVAECGGLGEK